MVRFIRSSRRAKTESLRLGPSLSPVQTAKSRTSCETGSVARLSAEPDTVSIGCAEASYECVCARCSLAPGASFVLVAAVSASAAEAESTLATLQAAKDIENTVAPVVKTEKLSKMTQQELTTQALKLTTGRLRRHLMQYSAHQCSDLVYPTLECLASRLCVCVSCGASIFYVEPTA